MKIKFSINKKQLILDYKTLGSLTGISKKYNICRQTVANRFNKLGIFYKTKIHKYISNENFFKKENECVFYWAGFLAADGCLHERKDKLQQLCLKLAGKDVNH